MTRSRIEFQGLFVRTEQTIETDVADVGLSLLFADSLPIPDNYTTCIILTVLMGCWVYFLHRKYICIYIL